MRLSWPVEEGTSFGWLSDQFNFLAETLGFDPVLQVRSVVVRDDAGDWHHFATVARPSDLPPAGPVQLDLGRIRLLESIVEVQGSSRKSDLRRALTSWRGAVGAPTGFAMRESTNPQRIASHNAWDESPCYVFTLQEEIPGFLEGRLPEGPFFLQEPQLFGETVGEIAADWLRTPELMDRFRSRSDRFYTLVLPDRRLWLKDLELEEGQLRVSLAGRGAKDENRVVVRVTDSTGRSSDQVHAAGETLVSVDVPGFVGALKVWLLAGRHTLDQFEESPYRTTWSRSVINPRQGKLSLELRQALEGGENDAVEFKSWIAARNPDSKLQEILESAVAFANRRGGSIYIGVSDSGEPVGVRRELRGAYVKDARGDEAEMKNLYAADLRRVLAEGIDPALEVQFSWIMHAGEPILVIAVPARGGTIHSVVKTGNVYVRAGGTNRKMRHADVVEWVGRGPVG